ncbi:hypothetical protein JSQ81_05405 [Sporosarcina sp. Marseille-Q4063]|uniref:hypothetical protein n=1 Tax=Sporosarcina sp. Marseille-Q4063 TaxID=2810514 RepID=UPI001BAEFE64|nr:hypothetical protein [Sporosarcina sp. Marseille-Q4063]QUW23008.1 hypothetical protein JSQ81_05405 [Sporosarcina sp. Marseille-Q4063]
MEYELGNGISLHLPHLHITIIAIIIIILLVRWSKQLETRRFTIFFYFLISAYIAPVFSQSTMNGAFEIWLPVGFIFMSIYLYGNKRSHPAKVKASILGFSIALYQLILHYIG